MPGDRIPHSVLPTAEMGTAQQEIPVFISFNKVVALYFTITFTCVGATALSAAVGVNQLDKATAKQCLTHDWPADKHQVHMDWCADNNYPTN